MRIFILAALALCAVTAGCSTADLRPDNMTAHVDEQAVSSGTAALDDACEFMGQRHFDNCGVVQVELTDSWASSLLRVFTPLENDEVKLRLDFQPSLDCFQIEIRSGDGKGEVFGCDGNGAFQLLGGERHEEGNSVRHYLHSLSLYLSLPLLAFDFATDIGEAELNGKTYRKVYASPAGADLDENADQYVFWFPQEGGYPRFVEFTYRKIGAGFSGTIDYSNWMVSSGIHFPGKIMIVDEPGDTDASHTITIDSIRVVNRSAASEEGIFDPAVFTFD